MTNTFRRSRNLAVIVALLLGSIAARPTTAAVTFTPPVDAVGPTRVLCRVQNVGDMFESVDITLRNGANEVLLTSDEFLSPGEATGIAYLDDVVGANCIFEFNGDPRRVRGAIALSELGNNPTLLQANAFEVLDASVVPVETFTAPVRHISGGIAACRVQNLSEGPVSVTAALVGANGVVIVEDSAITVAGRVMTVVSTLSPSLGVYCRFSFVGSPERVRGYLATQGGPALTTRLVLPAERASLAPSAIVISPAIAGIAGDATSCVAQNLDDVATDVSAELVDRFGQVLAAATKVVAPAAVESITGTTEAAAHAVCRFTYPAAGSRVRGFISQFPSGLFADTRLVEAALPVLAALATRPQTTYSTSLANADRRLECVVVNRAGAGVHVDARIDDLVGNTVATGEGLAPAGLASILVSTNAVVPGGTCRFDFEVAPDRLSTSAMLSDPAGMRTFLQVPAEAVGTAWTPTPTPTSTATVTPTTTSTSRPTFTSTTTATRTRTSTPTTTPTPSPTATATPSLTQLPTATATSTWTPTPSSVPTSSPTAVPTATATAVLTGTSSPLATATPNGVPTETPTPVPAPECVGDCNSDGEVTVDEIVTMVSVALGDAGATCPAGDRDGDGEVTVDEILASIGHALIGC